MQVTRSFFHAFGWSVVISIAGIVAALIGLGPAAAFAIVILIAIEITFSFDNAIINAKILSRLSPVWQKLFLSVGVIIAVLGMRVLFPIVIVSFSAHMSWYNTVTLALHNPGEYAAKLKHAHVTIAAFGGAFLLLLALYFFMYGERKDRWLERIERRLQHASNWWLPSVITLLAVSVVAALPANHTKQTTIIAGLSGMVVFGLIRLTMIGVGTLRGNGLSSSAKQAGLSALVTFLYLEILDASFSFDSVIGAFAITDKIVLIALGLGLGALWVRSLTVFIVRQGTLSSYKYLEHGAHYAILVLALALLLSIVIDTPDPNTPAGIIGILLIAASFYSSKRAIT